MLSAATAFSPPHGDLLWLCLLVSYLTLASYSTPAKVAPFPRRTALTASRALTLIALLQDSAPAAL